MLLIRREEGSDFQEFFLEPVTSYVRRRLKERFMEEEWKEQLRVYESFASLKQLRRLASVVFESMVQLQLQKEVVLNLVPMWNLRGTENPTWTSHPIAANTYTGIPIRFKPENVVKYEGSTLKVFHPCDLYVPTSSKQVAFDAFVLVDGVLYIFRFSEAPSHGIKGDMMDFFSQPTLYTMLQGAKWRFVFITPLGLTITCDEPSITRFAESRERVTLFSAEFDPKKQG